MAFYLLGSGQYCSPAPCACLWSGVSFLLRPWLCALTFSFQLFCLISLCNIFYLGPKEIFSWQAIGLSLKCAGSRIGTDWRTDLLKWLRSLLFLFFFPSLYLVLEHNVRDEEGKYWLLSSLWQSMEDESSCFILSYLKYLNSINSFKLKPSLLFSSLVPSITLLGCNSSVTHLVRKESLSRIMVPNKPFLWFPPGCLFTLQNIETARASDHDEKICLTASKLLFAYRRPRNKSPCICKIATGLSLCLGLFLTEVWSCKQPGHLIAMREIKWPKNLKEETEFWATAALPTAHCSVMLCH